MKLFFTPGACSMAPHIIANELNLSVSFEQVDLAAKTYADGADYLQINAKGYVPALQLDNGHVITEDVAILQYLADQKPEQNLAPSTGADKYEVISLLNFIATEIHKGLGSFFNPAQSEDWKQSATATLNKRLDWLAARLGDNTYLLGENFSVADAYLFTVLGWAGHVGFSLENWPVLGEYLQRVGQRPAVVQTLKEEGLI